jgi:hypothetical protein
MTLDIPVSEIIEEVGHDGGEIVFPHLREPACRRGFHSQELVKIAWQHRYAMTPIELFPTTRATVGTKTHPVWTDKIERQASFAAWVHSSVGILEGVGTT